VSVKPIHLFDLTIPAGVQILNRNLAEIAAEINSSTPRYTPTTQPKNPTVGMTYYDVDLKKVRTWDGTDWNDHWA